MRLYLKSIALFFMGCCIVGLFCCSRTVFAGASISKEEYREAIYAYLDYAEAHRHDYDSFLEENGFEFFADILLDAEDKPYLIMSYGAKFQEDDGQLLNYEYLLGKHRSNKKWIICGYQDDRVQVMFTHEGEMQFCTDGIFYALLESKEAYAGYQIREDQIRQFVYADTDSADTDKIRLTLYGKGLEEAGEEFKLVDPYSEYENFNQNRALYDIKGYDTYSCSWSNGFGTLLGIEVNNADAFSKNVKILLEELYSGKIEENEYKTATDISFLLLSGTMSPFYFVPSMSYLEFQQYAFEMKQKYPISQMEHYQMHINYTDVYPEKSVRWIETQKMLLRDSSWIVGTNYLDALSDEELTLGICLGMQLYDGNSNEDNGLSDIDKGIAEIVRRSGGFYLSEEKLKELYQKYENREDVLREFEKWRFSKKFRKASTEIFDSIEQTRQKAESLLVEDSPLIGTWGDGTEMFDIVLNSPDTKSFRLVRDTKSDIVFSDICYREGVDEVLFYLDGIEYLRYIDEDTIEIRAYVNTQEEVSTFTKQYLTEEQSQWRKVKKEYLQSQWIDRSSTEYKYFFLDLTEDGVPEILITNCDNGEGDPQFVLLYVDKDNKLQEVTLQGCFKGVGAEGVFVSETPREQLGKEYRMTWYQYNKDKDNFSEIHQYVQDLRGDIDWTNLELWTSEEAWEDSNAELYSYFVDGKEFETYEEAMKVADSYNSLAEMPEEYDIQKLKKAMEIFGMDS